MYGYDQDMSEWRSQFPPGTTVEFLGYSAEVLRKKSLPTTGVIREGDGEGDPRIHVELDTEQNSGLGGGRIKVLNPGAWRYTQVTIRRTSTATRNRIEAEQEQSAKPR